MNPTLTLNQKPFSEGRVSDAFTASCGRISLLNWENLRTGGDAMATLIERRDKWYARIRFYANGRRIERQIPLLTESKVTARERLSEVNRYEQDIKNGMMFHFPWQQEQSYTKLKHLTIAEASKQFLNGRLGEGIGELTVKRNRCSLNALMKVTGKSFPIERISIDTIISFKERYHGLHTKQGINLNLRLIKTFLFWCESKGYIQQVPKFKMIKCPQVPPSYLTDGEFADIQALRGLNSFYKRLFTFHRDTGLRLSEPYSGQLDGNWLVIDATATKQKKQHEIELSANLIRVWYEMMSRYDAWLKKGRKPENFTSHISKKFLWACRKASVDKHKFHDLRHTFAVRAYLLTRDIYLVKQLLGHSSVTITEKYANFSLRRLAGDFPSLKVDVSKREKTPNIGFGDTILGDTRVVSSSV